MGEIPSRVRIPLSPPINAPVAQLDRVSGYEPGGRRFESFRARHFQGNNQNKNHSEIVAMTFNVIGPEVFESKEVRPNAKRRAKSV